MPKKTAPAQTVKPSSSSWVVFALLGLGILLIGLAGNGSLLQGRLGGLSSGVFTIAPTSPSGARSVRAGDHILVFDINPSARDYSSATSSSFELALSSDGDFNTGAAVTVALKEESTGTIFGTGTVNFIDADMANASIVLSLPIRVLAGNSARFVLETNTVDLLHEEAGVDDPLNLILSQKAYRVDGHEILY